MEPNKENFMARLTSKNFSVEELLDDVDSLKEVLWYLDGGRTREIVETLFDAEVTSREESAQLIKNLAKLYPLSKSLIMSIMADSRELPHAVNDRPLYRDYLFLNGFDAAEETRLAIIATFNEINSNLFLLTREVKKYRKSLEELEGERDRLNETTETLETLRHERDELQAQIDRLRADNDEQKFREENENLHGTLIRLEGEKKRRQAELAEKRCCIKLLTAELAASADKDKSAEETQLLKELMKKFPSDAEDFKQ